MLNYRLLSVATLIDNTYIDQKDRSFVNVHTFSFGGKLTRNNLNFFQNGEYMDSTMKGVTILGEKQHVDHHTLVHHIEPNCERMLFNRIIIFSLVIKQQLIQNLN